MITAYKPTVVGQLDTLEGARERLSPARPNIDKLGSIIRRHGVQGWVGIVLLHRHFDIGADERLVAVRDGMGVTITPKLAGEAGPLTPYSLACTWNSVSEESEWSPLEFMLRGSAGSLTSRAEMLANHRQFLDEMAGALVDLGADKLFGISLLPEGHISPGADELSLESSDEANRILTVAATKSVVVDRGNITQTLWRFCSDTATAGAACFHCGNHCQHCGGHQ